MRCSLADTENYTALQSQKAVSTYFVSDQILSFSFSAYLAGPARLGEVRYGHHDEKTHRRHNQREVQEVNFGHDV